MSTSSSEPMTDHPPSTRPCRALDWCADNGVWHDFEGWNQDPDYFARAIEWTVGERDAPPKRREPS